MKLKAFAVVDTNVIVSAVYSKKGFPSEALSNDYFVNGKSFEGLNILPQNKAAFEAIKQSAIEYYVGVV